MLEGAILENVHAIKIQLTGDGLLKTRQDPQLENPMARIPLFLRRPPQTNQLAEKRPQWLLWLKKS